MREAVRSSLRRGAGLRRGVSVLQALALFSISLASAAAPALRERRFEFEYKATVKDIPAGAGRVELWLPVPHDDAFQKITGMEIVSPSPYEVRTSQYGNKVLHVSLTNPRQQSLTVTLRFTAARTEHVQASLQRADYRASDSALGADAAQWLRPDRLVPLDDKIRGWAREVVEAAGAKTDLERARAIYNHVVSTVKYDKTGQGWGRGDIYYACDARRGNCTDFHAIFIGYCRAVGIPARFAVGFPLPADRGQGAVSGYHCWAEFYLRGVGWVPVDASEAAKNPAKREYFFGAHDENRVEFTRGRDLVLSPRQQGEPLNYFVYPYAEVDGKAFAGVEKSFSYHDLAPAQAGGGR
ncbi:MAG TPA: transglutaminase domain-containing protein [Pyrinomonadaceae bacterium]|jgi:transglutaminase-like putative cysteine protease